LEENNLIDKFPKTMAKPAILFGKRAGNLLPAPYLMEMQSNSNLPVFRESDKL